MATVFLARLEGVAGFQRLFAIKRLHPHLANEGEFVDMFLDEARLAARIHHPNVVSILEVGTSAEGYYLVMEYIEGDTAARLLARCAGAGGRMPVGVAVRIALDTLLGLHAAHDLTDDDGSPLHIVHRDVSPQNILVGIDGVSRITDFGVAHAATRLSSTRTGQLKGKLAYMAPEQAKGAVVDRRSDVFAMGVVLWELLAGKRLFKAGNDAETLHRILFTPVPTLEDAGVPIPTPLEAVCMKALERDPAQRYTSAAEFADELERVGRSLGMLSTTREIATYVDGTIGAEISQQREVVRLWLSRSEPSRNDRLSVTMGPESRRASRSSLGPDDSGGRAALRRSSSRDVTVSVPAESSPVAAVKLGDVSSVSSAVLQMPEVTTTDSKVLFPASDWAGTFEPHRRRRVVLSAIGLAGLTVAVALGLALRPSPRGATRPHATEVSAAGTAPALPVVPADKGPARASSVAPPSPADPSSSARAPDGAPTPLASAPRPAGGPLPSKPRSGRPATALTSDDLPDDLSRNPYR